MGRDIHVHLVKFNKDKNIYEEVKIYRKNKNDDNFKPIRFCSDRNYELFEILDGNKDDYFPYRPIYTTNLSVDLQKEINEYQNITGYYNFYEVNLAEAELYLFKHPEIRDWDEDDIAYKPNPVANFIEEIKQVLYFYDDYWYYDVGYAGIRILYWFDC